MKLPGLRAVLKAAQAEPAVPAEERLRTKIRTGGAKFDRVILTANRRVMASVVEEGRTLRVSRLFLEAPDPVLAALGRTFAAPTAGSRAAARAEVRRYLSQATSRGLQPAPPSKPRRPRPSDRPHLARLRAEFDRVNAAYFGARLPAVDLRLSGRMRSRNGHFSVDPLEIAISRRLCEEAAAGESERTLRHEMIHLWQWVDGRKPGHGADFRRWARRLDIHPRATRPVCWTEAA